jgi:hypothetical protein
MCACMRDIDTVHKEINVGIHIDLDTYARVRNDRAFFFLKDPHSTQDDARGRKVFFTFFFNNFFEDLHSTEDDARGRKHQNV